MGEGNGKTGKSETELKTINSLMIVCVRARTYVRACECVCEVV